MWFWRAELSGRAHSDSEQLTSGVAVCAEFPVHTHYEQPEHAVAEVRNELWSIVEHDDDHGMTSSLCIYYEGECVYTQDIFSPIGVVDVGSMMLVLTDAEWIEDSDLIGEI